MEKNVLIAIVLVALLVGVAVCVWYFVLREDTSKKEPAEPTTQTGVGEYSKVKVLSQDESEEYGSVWVKDGEIMNEVIVEDVSEFVENNKESWESGTHEYPTGGMTEDGMLWDGIRQTTVDQPDFIRFIYVEIDDEFGEEYEIDLIE